MLYIKLHCPSVETGGPEPVSLCPSHSSIPPPVCCSWSEYRAAFAYGTCCDPGSWRGYHSTCGPLLLCDLTITGSASSLPGQIGPGGSLRYHSLFMGTRWLKEERVPPSAWNKEEKNKEERDCGCACIGLLRKF